jgi:hypothetical protein
MIPGNAARSIDYEQRRFGYAIVVAVDTIRRGHGALGFEVCRQREPQAEGFGVRRVTPRSVHGNTDKTGVVGIQRIQVFTVEA